MSLSTHDIEQLVNDGINASTVKVEGADGKYLVRVVSDSFDGLNAVKRQQAVYKILNPHIATGEIHAVSMDLMTPEEFGSRT